MAGSVLRRRAPLLGSTPPHQPTLFGPGFRLSADLDYFLQLSRHPSLRVKFPWRLQVGQATSPPSPSAPAP